MKAVILCAGEGERLRPLTLTTPKPLLPIGGRPLVEHTIDWLRDHDAIDLFINLHHLGERIESHLGDGSRFGVRITYSHEAVIQGTAGGLRAFRGALDGPFFVVYGDVLTRLDLDRLRADHEGTGGIGTLVAQHTGRPHDCDILEVDETRRITAFHRAPGSFDYGDLGSAALYLLEPEILDYIPEGGAPDFIADVFPPALAAGERLYAYESDEELLDIGTPERYEDAQRRFP